MSCRTARCARGDHFVVCDRFAGSSRWSAQDSFATTSERHAKPNTHHEVVAACVGRFYARITPPSPLNAAMIADDQSVSSSSRSVRSPDWNTHRSSSA